MVEALNLSVSGAEIKFDLRVGNIPHFVLTTAAGRRIEPLHRAPWIDDPDVLGNTALAPVDRRLAGDFFCAPFGENADAPPHGWPANSPWEVEDVTQTGRGAVAFLSLMRPVMGARLTKELRLVAGVPMLIQTHKISGGFGGITVAHHPMVHVAGSAWLSVSAKARAMTGDAPIVPGRHRLTCGAQSTDISAFPGVDDIVDLRVLPGPRGYEDFVLMAEAAGATLGWTALIREEEDDLIFVLKDPRVLPVTMLWLSNGGRIDEPWDGRHTGVVGIEDGCTAGLVPPEVAGAPNPVSAHGVRTVLQLSQGTDHEIRHVIGAVPRPEGWTRVERIAVSGARLILTEKSGATLNLPFVRGVFADGSSAAAP